MPYSRRPVCEWCKEPIPPGELEMGEVEIEREVHRERHRPTGLFSYDTQWEEDEAETIKERRPFHKECLRQYQQEGQHGSCLGATVTSLALIVVLIVVLCLLAAGGR